MTKAKLLANLDKVPDDATLMSNSGWECDPTDMDGVWYSAELNEVHFTQGCESRYEWCSYFPRSNIIIRRYQFERIGGNRHDCREPTEGDCNDCINCCLPMIPRCEYHNEITRGGTTRGR